MRVLPQPVLMLITEPVEPYERLTGIVTAAIAGGVNIVQARDKSGDSAALFRAAHFAFCFKPRKVLLFVNCSSRSDLGVPYVMRVDGVHVPEKHELPLERLLTAERRRFIGFSVHSQATALQAAEAGADYIVAGTIYESQSHPGEPGQGIEYLREVCEAVAPLPVIAIGGITPERVGECIAAGAAGIAVLSPIMRADDPRAVAARYREELDKAWNLRSTEKA